MPPPKRPFTTNSLTSTLKSTIANQPLLSNLTNIDKLSSQASSLAHKTPFFSAINQHHDAQSSSGAPANNTNSSSNNNSINTNTTIQSNISGPQANMMRSVGSSGGQQRPPMKNAPTVDMSHLTEEERLMIQSVMAKAEMADMGMPVDTSATSSTNLPSNASQALVQQAEQQQLHNRQQANQMSMGASNVQQAQQRPQQQPAMSQAQQSQHDFMQHQAQMNMMMANSNNNQRSNNDQALYQHPHNEQGLNSWSNQSFNSQVPQFQQAQQNYQNMQSQLAHVSQANSIDIQKNQPNNLNTQSMIHTRNQLPSLEQQTQQLVNQINTQFNLGQNQQQPPTSQTRNISNLQNVHQQFVNQQQQQQSDQQNLNDQQVLHQQRQQIPNMNSFDQSILANQTQGLATMNPQQTASDRQQIQQLQQQQLQQPRLNAMLNDQTRLLQTNQGQLHPVFGLSNQEAMMNDQLRDTNTNFQHPQFVTSNQHANLNNFPNTPGQHQRPNLNSLDIMNAQVNLNRMDPLTIETQSVVPNFVPQQQTELVDATGNRINLPYLNTTGSDQRDDISQQVSTRSINNNEMPHQRNLQAFSREQYHDPRSDIQFGSQRVAVDTDYHDHALSDQEYYGGHSRNRHNRSGLNVKRYDSTTESIGTHDSRASTRHVKSIDHHSQKESADVRDRNLQAYDLAHRAPKISSRHKLRQLPQPNERSLQSSNEQLQGERQANNTRSRESKHQTSDRKSVIQDFKQDSPNHMSESEEDGDIEGKEEKVDIEKRFGSNRKPSPSNSSSKDVTDKNEEALRLLSELKLSKQANQVMEQQQLLIKQSQELIKLQLEQQALSQELKKSIIQNVTPSISSQQIGKTKELKEQESNDQTQIQLGEKMNEEQEEGGRESNLSENHRSSKEISDDPMRRSNEEKNLLRNTSRSDQSTKKSTSFCNDDDSDMEENSPHVAPKSRLTRSNDPINDVAERGVKGRFHEREKLNIRKSTAANLSQNSQISATPKYNRDLLQSPTDTTDSDIEPLSQASNIRRPHQSKLINQSKSKSVVRRREPTGLPPSPLPVSAAIQLHQMQQQHYRQVGGAGNVRGNLNRTNFMRSRSVTSSPNHHLEQITSGYLTDNQRIRSTSPDTLSEFGGQRRRKRLPEPPTNTVAITPSMVRKMIQARGTGSMPGKQLLNSVNAQSTLLTNTHSNRNLAFERPPNDTHASSRSSAYNETTQPSSLGGSFNHSSQHPPQTSESINPNSTISTSGTSDLNKFLSSTYGNSILRNNISDTKETPELDKLISNLDEYYGLDNQKRHVRLPLSSDVYSFETAYNNHHQTPIAAGTSFIGGASPIRAMGQSYLDSYPSKPSYHINPPSLMRCNSEGENNLASRLTRRPYRQPNQNLDDYKNYSRNLVPSTYLNGRASYLSSSPLRQLRYTTTNTNIPVSATERLRDHPVNLGDHWTSSSSAAGIGTTFDRTSQFYNPIQNQFSTNSRLYNPTGSFDCENLDYLTAISSAPNDHRPHFSGISEISGPNSKYHHRYTNASSNIDSIRDKYKYTGTQDMTRYDRYDSNAPALRYQSNLTSGDYGEARRSHLTSHQQTNLGQFQHKSIDHDPRRNANHNYKMNQPPFESRSRDTRSNHQPSDSTKNLNDSVRIDSSPLDYLGQDYPRQSSYIDTAVRPNMTSSSFAPLTKDDIINNGPKFNSIGYRFRTENQNKYVAQARTPIQCLQSRYPHPYKRILLSKNPKDRIGNGIGVRITGGQAIPSLYDKVNRCIVKSGAFVTEVFQDSNVYYMGEMQEGDQIIEWNGVNLCNRSNEEVQQILLSQFSDDEVEIVYLHKDKFNEAYDEVNPHSSFNDRNFQNLREEQDPFDTFADINKYGHQSSDSAMLTRGRYDNETPKGSIRRKISLSSIAHMWSK